MALAGFILPPGLAAPARIPASALEIAALTAAVLGGNSLGGGRGSAAKAVFGAIIVMLIINGLVRLGIASGAGA